MSIETTKYSDMINNGYNSTFSSKFQNGIHWPIPENPNRQVHNILETYFSEEYKSNKSNIHNFSFPTSLESISKITHTVFQIFPNSKIVKDYIRGPKTFIQIEINPPDLTTQIK